MSATCDFGLIGLAYFVRHSEPGRIKPAWLFMVLVGVTLLFAARFSLYQETEELEEDEWTELDELEYNASLYDSNGLYGETPIDAAIENYQIKVGEKYHIQRK